MNVARAAVVCCLMMGGSAGAAEPNLKFEYPFERLLLAQAQPAQPAQGNQPAAQQQGADQQGQNDAFAQNQGQGSEGSSSSGTGASNMVGDLNGGGFVRRLVLFPTTATFQVSQVFRRFDGKQFQFFTREKTVTVSGVVSQEVSIPFAARGAFKIAENESPLPTHRVFGYYSFFDNIGVLPSGTSNLAGSASVFSGATGDCLRSMGFREDRALVNLTSFVPARPLHRTHLHRETFGFESPFLDGNASIGVRVPLLQQVGEPTLENSTIGDVGIIGKYAFINNRETGNVLAGGLSVTAPTGESALAVDGTRIHSTLIQPYIGYLYNFGDFYVQGFTAVVVPSDSRDVTLFTQDVGIGYRLYQNNDAASPITRVTPTLEGHLTSPLNHRGATNSPVGFPDIFIGTAAVHVRIQQRSELTLGVAAPMTGPQPFDVEGIVQFNFRF